MEQRESKTQTNFKSGYKLMNILSYVDFAKLCVVIKYFPQFNRKIGKEDMSFTLLSISRVI